MNVLKQRMLVVAIAIIMVSMLILPVSAASVKLPPGLNQWDARGIWGGIMDLQGQIDALVASGTPGPIGPKGDTGATGATGATGSQGEVGPAGAIGATGATGAAGPQGPIGLTGVNGEQGIQGIPGVSGWERISAISSSGLGSKSVTATCTSGKKILGGGGYGATLTAITSSYPSADNAWTANGIAASGTLTAYAICATVT